MTYLRQGRRPISNSTRNCRRRPTLREWFTRRGLEQPPPLCRRPECDDISLLCPKRHETYLLRRCDAVFAPQVAVGFHRQGAAVFVSEPARNSWNVHATF